MITFEQVVVDEVSLTNRSGVDKLVVGADGALGAKVSTLSNPQRIVVDIPNVESKVLNELSAQRNCLILLLQEQGCMIPIRSALFWRWVS